jgi:hypothetical protein
MQTCWCFRLSDEELVLAKRVDTFIQRPRGAVPRSANNLDALGHLLHTRGLVARHRFAARPPCQPRRLKLQAAGLCGRRRCLALCGLCPCVIPSWPLG